MALIYDILLAVPLDAPHSVALSEAIWRGNANAIACPSTEFDCRQWIEYEAAAGRLRVEQPAGQGGMLYWHAAWDDQRFYVDFQPLLEWLATICHRSSFVGTYHARGLRHPSTIYLAAGVPYALQCVGVPAALQTGLPMDDNQLAALTSDDDDDGDDGDEFVESGEFDDGGKGDNEPD